MRNFFTLLVVCLFCFAKTNAQTRYIIKLKNKATNPFSLANPSAYLGPRALERRARYNIAIDSLDLPVTPRYIDSIRLAGSVVILNASKWLNQVTIRTSDPVALAKINSFSFVISSVAVASKEGIIENPVNKKLDEADDNTIPTSEYASKVEGDVFSYGTSNGQVRIHKGEFLHNLGYRGNGMQIAVLDAGFYHYLSLPTFDSARTNSQILNTYDFVANEISVDEDNTHGMQCLSTIAANMPGVFMGTAPKATFCLYRTEDVASETKIEEHNLAAGYERADSIGVDVCSVSLGYSTFDNSAQNYSYANMDGNTTMSAIASDIAAKKGMLPVVAAGNDGNGSWRFIATPADADSVMTVGAVDTLGNIASFSSYGPSADGQIKPNVAAVGTRAVVANSSNGMPTFGNGTSFATPNIAGLTTCLWQAFPEFNNMAILDAMQKSASRYNTPNDRVGYGIPDMKKAFIILIKKSFTKQVTINDCTATIKLNIKHDNNMKVVVERKQSNQVAYSIIKTMDGLGSFTNKNITFSDDLALTSGGDVVYRIKLDIGTDTSAYIDSIIVNAPILCTNPVNKITLNTNPVTNFANVIISRATDSKISLVLTNALGQKIYTNAYQQKAGSQIKNIDLQNQPNGVYFLQVFADDKKIETLRIVRRQ
jgi:serine protease AprX